MFSLCVIENFLNLYHNVEIQVAKPLTSISVTQSQDYQEHSLCESGADCRGVEEKVRERKRQKQEPKECYPASGAGTE